MGSPGDVKYRVRKATTRIIVHDSHTGPLGWGPKQIKDDTERMGLISVGYHFVFPRGGGRIQFRPLDCVGAHTPGHNDDSIGVCWEGGRDELGYPCPNIGWDQRREMILFCCDMMDLYGKTLRIAGHSEVQRYRHITQATCPQMDMELFRQDLHDYQKGLAI